MCIIRSCMIFSGPHIERTTAVSQLCNPGLSLKNSLENLINFFSISRQLNQLILNTPGSNRKYSRRLMFWMMKCSFLHTLPIVSIYTCKYTQTKPICYTASYGIMLASSLVQHKMCFDCVLFAIFP